MIIDCDDCAVRGSACADCVIGVLLGPPGSEDGWETRAAGSQGVPSGAPIVQLDAPERRALGALADQGLVPRLRLVATRPRRTSTSEPNERTVRDTG